MKFWRGNRIDAGFEMPVSEVADQFVTWYQGLNPDSQGYPMERALRSWLTHPEYFNSVWVDETGDESFAELLDLVIGLVYGRGDPDYSVNHVS